MTGCSRQGIACLCAGVTRAELAEAIAADPASTVESLGAALGCGVQCGSCLPVLKEALGEAAWYPASASCRPITRARDPQGRERLIYKVELALHGNSPYPVVVPGQHVVLRAQVDGEAVERTYTVVAQDPRARRLTIAIRRKPEGRLTPWLLRLAEDAAARTVELSAPGGPGLASPGLRSVVFFAAGVGVTPAVAMVSALGPAASMHLHYSVHHADDAAFLPKLEARRKERPGFSHVLWETAVHGNLGAREVREIARRHAGARFYLCGPEGYVEAVHRALRAARVERSRIHVEQFALSPARAPARSPRVRAYAAGMLLSVLPCLMLLPALQELRPHGHPNVGHEQLQCASCHTDAGASTRQVLQAKVKHALGLRQTGAVLGMQPVTNGTCVRCHVNPDDQHAPHRFLEPRFEQARAETGAQLCVSCHREHSQQRVTAPSAGFCASCHADLKVRADRSEPSHATLVGQKRWDTCLQCHDYHGNHRRSAPLRLRDAATPGEVAHYLKDGPSPFGSTIAKARQDKSL